MNYRTRKSISIVLEVLAKTEKPLRVRGIMHRGKFSSESRCPQNTIARDIAMDIKENPNSRILRVGYGLYALRVR